MQELGRRVSAQEFAEWYVYFTVEGLLPQDRRVRRARAMAALNNGATERRDKRMWSAADFGSADPWSVLARPPAQAAVLAPGQRPPSQAARMKALLAGRRQRH